MVVVLVDQSLGTYLAYRGGMLRLLQRADRRGMTKHKLVLLSFFKELEPRGCGVGRSEGRSDGRRPWSG